MLLTHSTKEAIASAKKWLLGDQTLLHGGATADLFVLAWLSFKSNLLNLTTARKSGKDSLASSLC